MQGPREDLIDELEEQARQQHEEEGGTEGDGGLLSREEIDEYV